MHEHAQTHAHIYKWCVRPRGEVTAQSVIRRDKWCAKLTANHTQARVSVAHIHISLLVLKASFGSSCENCTNLEGFVCRMHACIWRRVCALTLKNVCLEYFKTASRASFRVALGSIRLEFNRSWQNTAVADVWCTCAENTPETRPWMTLAKYCRYS